jgi:hypothetical protein
MADFLRGVARVSKLATHDPSLMDSLARFVNLGSRWESLLLGRCDLFFSLVLLK